MGVISCSRKGCDGIMCDRNSPTHGNICSDCFDELVATGPTTDIETFMNSEKKPDTKDEAFARYDYVFSYN